MTELAKPPSSKNRSEWRNPLVIAMLIYYVVMAVVGLWIPDNILKDNPGAREFSDFMAKIVPQIDRITALNIKPDVNRFYFSVLWAASPIVMFLTVAAGLQGRRKGIKFESTRLRLFLSWMVGTSMCYLMVTGVFLDARNKLSLFLFGTDFIRAFVAQFVFSIGPAFALTGLIILMPLHFLLPRSE
jgi:hypothetical protein